MAVINISFGHSGGHGGQSTNVPVFRDDPDIPVETITSAGASTESAESAPFTAGGDLIAVVRIATDVAIWVDRGASPTAVVNTSLYIPAGYVEHLYVKGGQSIAVLEA